MRDTGCDKHHASRVSHPASRVLIIDVVELTPLPNQRRAIEAPMGPVLVVAGPGAGKTFCLIARIQHLIAGGIDPHRICAVTFTNRAAEEIALRLRSEEHTSEL